MGMGKKKDIKKKPSKDNFKWVSDFFATLKYPKEIEIAERLKEQKGDMENVYKEITEQVEKLPLSKRVRLKQLDELAEKKGYVKIAETDIKRWKTEEIKKINIDTAEFRLYSDILLSIVSGAILYNEEAATAAKNYIKDINELQKDIIKTVEKLIKQLNSHEKKQTTAWNPQKNSELAGPQKTRIISDADTDVIYLIKKADKKKALLFDTYVLPLINQIHNFEDDRYLPTLQEFLRALIQEFKEKGAVPMFQEDAAALNSNKVTHAFTKYFLSKLETIKKINFINEFNLSKNSLRIIAKSALKLEAGMSDHSINKLLTSPKNPSRRFSHKKT
ncbi:MAG: hypothetical protein A2W22_06935 [Candidatus Levybacteria bacterium RBG_16_35_11]|nr:MAG: hypothetical protein A2W22_06935 [Candidatus Levybacteria bacterium RBG_16_35_11]